MCTLRQYVALAGALALTGCVAEQPVPEPPDTRAAEEAAIRAAVEDWSGAAEAKDAEKSASFYAEDGVLMLENAPDAHGLSAIKTGISSMMQDPNFALSFAADKVVVARSGDLAYETGSYTLTLSGPDQNPVTQKGSYVDIWRKDASGAWKVVVDAPVSDPPEEPAE